jgi:hypothetical protein
VGQHHLAFHACYAVILSSTDFISLDTSTARLEYVFPYLQGEQIKVRVRQLSSRSLNGESLFQSTSSQSFERLVARERSFSSKAHRIEEDKRMWNDFFSVPDDQNETSMENTDDANEVRLTFIEVRIGFYYDAQGQLTPLPSNK